jgi:multidrug resistance protein, MATE family
VGESCPGVEGRSAAAGRWDRVRRGLGAELGPTMKLAGPVVLAELGWMGMGVVDTVMVGRLGPTAIGAVGVGNILFFTVVVFGYGLLLGLDTLVSQSYGAGRRDDCRRWLVHGVYLALATTPPIMLAVELCARNLTAWGIDPAVAREAVPYIRTLNWGTLPLGLFGAFRRYLQATDRVRPVTVALWSANLFNLAGNWVLVYGNLGAPALGVVGSGWSTFLARVAMAMILVVAVALSEGEHWAGRRRTSLGLEWGRMRRLLGLGWPAASQITAEVGVFAAAAVLAGRLGPVALASHEVVLHTCGVTFMVPLGISSAGSVRVGHAVGRGDPPGAARAGWAALLVGGGFMAMAALTFLAVPRAILAIFTADPAVTATGVRLLAVAALFQLFDGLQVVATGALRGLGDTRTPLYCNLASHWAFGLPVAYGLAFPAGLGVFGLWVGLALGLIATGMVLLAAWSTRVRSFGRGVAPLAHPAGREAPCACP